ncbi:MAG: hypothetical protein K6G36_03285 [Candidatus Saccharibacteria bacterium]|nr:hypothetical protein [Candidatus Saccharibacteria bacterium]
MSDEKLTKPKVYALYEIGVTQTVIVKKKKKKENEKEEIDPRIHINGYLMVDRSDQTIRGYVQDNADPQEGVRLVFGKQLVGQSSRTGIIVYFTDGEFSELVPNPTAYGLYVENVDEPGKLVSWKASSHNCSIFECPKKKNSVVISTKKIESTEKANQIICMFNARVTDDITIDIETAFEADNYHPILEA